MQKQFAYDLLAAARDSGINTAVETCGAVPWEAIEPAVGLVDTFFIRCQSIRILKSTEILRERQIEDVLRNIRRLGDENAHIIRVPLIPEFNDTAEELSAIAEVAADAGAERMDVLPFHKLALSKHDAMEDALSDGSGEYCRRSRWIVLCKRQVFLKHKYRGLRGEKMAERSGCSIYRGNYC